MDQTVTESAVLAVNLTMTPELASELQREQGALDLARAYTITGSPEERAFIAKEANTCLQSVKGKMKWLKEKKAGFVAPAKQIIANAEALFDPALEALGHAETFLKGQLSDYSVECQRLADEARRKRDEEERAARQKAEREAAAVRARAEEQAAADRKAAREAEERRVAAEREGNTRAAAAAAAEKAKLEQKAEATLENAEAKAAEVSLTASATPLSTIVPEAAKLEGFSTRENWVAELAPGKSEEDAVVELAAAITRGRRDLLPLLKRDPAASNRLAKAQRKNMSAPGLVAVNRPIAASRAG